MKKMRFVYFVNDLMFNSVTGTDKHKKYSSSLIIKREDKKLNLRGIASALGVKNYTKLKKDDLIHAILLREIKEKMFTF